MKRTTAILITIVLLLITNIGTYYGSKAYETYKQHPIERMFKKLPKGYQLFVMYIGLASIQKRKIPKKSLKINNDI